MTRSPFPGMDPWFEGHWGDFHLSTVVYISNQLQRQLPRDLVARIEETEVKYPPGSESQPDRLLDPEVDRHVEILDFSSDERIVSAITILSPSNKLPGEGRKAYRSKQRNFVSAGVNLVEIDFVRLGDWVFSIAENALPVDRRTPYLICVFRATQPDERAFYPLPLRERLPRFAIPLRSQDKDIVLDLQPVIDEAYETGRYDRTDYRRPLKPPLPPEDVAWATEILRKAGRL